MPTLGALAPQGVALQELRGLCCGVWHQDIGSGSFGCCGCEVGPPQIGLVCLEHSMDV